MNDVYYGNSYRDICLLLCYDEFTTSVFLSISNIIIQNKLRSFGLLHKEKLNVVSYREVKRQLKANSDE